MLHCAATAAAVSESKPSQAGPAAVSSRYDIDACLGDIRAGIDEAAATEDPYHFRHDRLHRRNGVEYVELDGPLGQHPNLPMPLPSMLARDVPRPHACDGTLAVEGARCKAARRHRRCIVRAVGSGVWAGIYVAVGMRRCMRRCTGRCHLDGRFAAAHFGRGELDLQAAATNPYRVTIRPRRNVACCDVVC
jgi:hypothetical protein